MKALDLAGKKFGRLTAIRKTGEKKGSFVVWECVCDCGKIAFVASHQLKSGKTKSCGCYRTDKLSERKAENLIGKRYGRLTVTGEKIISTSKAKRVIKCVCLCDCGKEIDVFPYQFKSGDIQSCGCIRTENLKENAAERYGLVENTSLSYIASSKPSKANTSGVKGVSYNSKQRKWKADITINGTRYYLGMFGSIEEAAKARKLGEEKYYAPMLEKYNWQRKGEEQCT